MPPLRAAERRRSPWFQVFVPRYLCWRYFQAVFSLMIVGAGQLMNDKHKRPVPITPKTETKVCPVCGQSSYSVAGIHPQCATVLADAPRSERLRAAKKSNAEKKVKPSPSRSWLKKCPNCGADVHVRKKLCDCGALLDAQSR